jgi:hypothetical protein
VHRILMEQAFKLKGNPILDQILVKRVSCEVHNTTFNYWERLIMDYVVNVIVTTLLDFRIFWGEWIQDDYVKKIRPRLCMFMQKIRLGW